MKSIFVRNKYDMYQFAKYYSKKIKFGQIIYLYGDLGSGKTTFVRGVLSAYGYKGFVKSPTYNIVEFYKFKKFYVYHFDLYRLSNPQELELIGIREYFNKSNIYFVEWPNNGKGYLPTTNIKIYIKYLKYGRQVYFY